MGGVNSVWIIGAGGFGRETLNVYRDAGREAEVAGFLEEHCKNPGQVLNGKLVRDWSTIAQLPKGIRVIAGIGSVVRRRLIEEAAQRGLGFDTAIHPTVNRSQWVNIKEGCIVCANCILTTQIDVGPHAILNLACTIGHDVTIGSYVTLSPGVHVSGRVIIEDEVFVGSGAVIIERIRIGRGAVVGAGAVVTKDVEPGTTVVGVPARPVP